MAPRGLVFALSGKRRLKDSRGFLLIAFAVAMATDTDAVMADRFGPVRYDPKNDELIVTMIYDGTNPNHHFSIQWGGCKVAQPAKQIIELSILDDQRNDAATKTYTETVRVPLATLSVGQQR